MTPRAILLLDIVLGASAWGVIIACGRAIWRLAQ